MIIYENVLKFEVIWKYQHLLELEITVSNNGYNGVARGYDTADLLKKLADQDGVAILIAK